MKKIFTLFLALAASVGSIFAEEVYVDGFTYDIQCKLYEYIKQEQNNIDKLLTENIEH